MPDTHGPAEAVALTQALVRIPSENPVGTEADMAAFVHDWLSALPGAEVEVREVLPGRSNVIARLPSTGNLPALALIAHMDTVPFGEGWTLSPTSGEIVDGKLYGRGSCDMKSGLAVAMYAFAAAARTGRKLDRTLLMCATVDEEGAYMRGANALVDDGTVDGETLVVATEPSNLEVMVAHKGLLWVEVEVTGKLAHAGNPGVGVDAIRAGAEFVHAMKREIDALPHRHPTLGKAEITFSAFNGGIKTNVVPDHARLEMDIRLPPPMTIGGTLAIVEKCAREVEGLVAGSKIVFRQFNNDRPPVEADRDGVLTRCFVESAGAVTGRQAVVSVFPAYTDASVVQARTGNVNCLVFGPGRLAQAHTVDEFVPVDQVEKDAATLEGVVQRLCFGTNS
jgi:succinyl-diaminopimelate desuccinylase